MRHDDPTINTISKTLEAQEKTQDIKHSLSTKMETKPDARSRRNELIEVTERNPYRDRTRPINCSATAGVSSSDQTLSIESDRTHRWHCSPSRQHTHTDRTLAANRPDAGIAAFDRVQRGSRVVKLRPDVSGGM